MSSIELNHDTTAFEVLQKYKTNLSGFEVIVTGGSSGIGIETVRAVAKAGARCVIAARDMVKAKQVADDVILTTGNSNVECEELELDSLKSVNSFVQRYLEKKRPLHILINNAGVMACPLSYTKDGIEMQFGTNHIGHFALTLGLLPALKQAAQLSGRKSRVVNVSSTAHVRSDIDFDDVNFKKRQYDGFISYGQSKTANILFSIGLTNRFKDEGIVSTAVMPGVIQTNLQRHMDQATIEGIKTRFKKWKSLEQGASTTVWAAVAPEFENVGGLYLENCTISKQGESREKIYEVMFGYMPYVMNPESVEKLWTLSEQIVKEHSN